MGAFEPGKEEEEPGVLSPEQQKKLLDFDYFATSAEEVEEVSQQGGGKEKPPPPPQDTETEVEGETEAEDEAESESEDEEEEGEKAAAPTEPIPGKQFQEELLTAVRSLQPPTTPPGTPAPRDDDPLPQYNFQVRKEIAEALASEDANVRAAAINAIANGVALNVHAQIRAETAQRTQQVIQSYMNRHLTARDESKKIQDDFYGTYPQLDKPAIRAAVVEVTKAVYDGREPWSPRLRKKIAEETARQLGIKLADPAGRQSSSGVEQNTQRGTEANGARKPGRKPPKVLAGGARPGTPAGKSSQVDDIADTLFGSDRR